MKIAIIGAGQVGRAIGGQLSRKHEITFAVRDVVKAEKGAAGAIGKVVPLAAASSADVLILATPFEAAAPALKACGNLDGKVVIDATNPLTRDERGLSLKFGFDRSAAEEIARAVPGIRLYKAFNQTGFDNMQHPERFSPRPVMFVAGDDAAGKAVVLEIVADAGFTAIDAGPLDRARLLEPLAMLWIDLALARGQGRDFAFALVRAT
jgi:8-hydroxy-5-deazaflavin:NADPH oxidoreductase